MSSKISEPLREWMAEHRPGEEGVWMVGAATLDELAAIAGQIDHDHDSRMERCRRETKRAFAKAIRRAANDYACNIKHVRTRDSKRKVITMTNESTIGSCACTECGAFVGRYDRYCSKCGAKLVDE